MCGIYGSTKYYSLDKIQSKLKRTSFRGPDQTGIKTYKTNSKNLYLAHNRLSIIDLDARSNQPFSYSDKIEIVFNGEIFNFKELKIDLVKKGYEFKTTSDTEVICASYLEYGEDCVKHFNGMFAIVIYDKENEILFGARDRLGQKPFYYYHNGLDFEFSSQISSIQLYHDNLTISSKAINYYLAWGTIPDPYSIFNEISKLKAGWSFAFNLNTGELNKRKYWDIDYKGHNIFSGSYNDAKAELYDLLESATDLRMFADVPVGVFLSGGIDSSLVSAIAAKTSKNKVKTFAVKFNEKGFDESYYAGEVAKHLKTDHTVIECNYKEGIDLIDTFSHFYDEPFADASAVPSMLLSKYTRQNVTVALSGDAGDENFIGYNRYDWIRRVNKAYGLPDSIRKVIASLLRLAPKPRYKIMSNVLQQKNVDYAYLFAMIGTNKSWYDDTVDVLDIEEKKYLEHSHKGLFERVTDFDLKTYLNWDINTKVDRASMAYSLEVRSPLLDYRVVEFARSLPTEYKYKDGVMKRILKDLLYEHVPKDLFDRPKSGFTMPFSNWFRNDLKDYVLDELNGEGLSQIPFIKKDKVNELINQHMSGNWDNYYIIWKLLILKQWLNINGKSYSIK
jgi:asparagine synthase (glutamine-hydrolysing)